MANSIVKNIFSFAMHLMALAAINFIIVLLLIPHNI